MLSLQSIFFTSPFDITVLFSSSSSFLSSLFFLSFHDKTPPCSFCEWAEFFLACYLLMNRADLFSWTVFSDHLTLFHPSPQSSPGFPRWCSGKESAWQCRRCGFNPWVGKIFWGRKWQPYSSTLAWKIPWTEEPGGLKTMRSPRVGHDWAHTCTHTHSVFNTEGWILMLRIVHSVIQLLMVMGRGDWGGGQQQREYLASRHFSSSSVDPPEFGE